MIKNESNMGNIFVELVLEVTPKFNGSLITFNFCNSFEQTKITSELHFIGIILQKKNRS